MRRSGSGSQSTGEGEGTAKVGDEATGGEGRH